MLESKDWKLKPYFFIIIITRVFYAIVFSVFFHFCFSSKPYLVKLWDKLNLSLKLDTEI